MLFHNQFVSSKIKILLKYNEKPIIKSISHKLTDFGGLETWIKRELNYDVIDNLIDIKSIDETHILFHHLLHKMNIGLSVKVEHGMDHLPEEYDYIIKLNRQNTENKGEIIFGNYNSDCDLTENNNYRLCDKQIAFIARPVIQKRFDKLYKVMEILTSWCVVIAGVNSISSNNIHYIGFINDTMNLIKSSDIVLSLSDEEGGPMIIVDSACLGKPSLMLKTGVCGMIPNVVCSDPDVNSIVDNIKNMDLSNKKPFKFPNFSMKNEIDRMISSAFYQAIAYQVIVEDFIRFYDGLIIITLSKTMNVIFRVRMISDGELTILGCDYHCSQKIVNKQNSEISFEHIKKLVINGNNVVISNYKLFEY